MRGSPTKVRENKGDPGSVLIPPHSIPSPKATTQRPRPTHREVGSLSVDLVGGGGLAGSERVHACGARELGHPLLEQVEERAHGLGGVAVRELEPRARTLPLADQRAEEGQEPLGLWDQTVHVALEPSGDRGDERLLLRALR